MSRTPTRSMTAGIVALGATAAMLTACSGPAPELTGASQPTTAASPATASSTGAPSSEPATSTATAAENTPSPAETGGDKTLEFGQAAAFTDPKLRVTFTLGKRVTLSSSAAGDSPDHTAQLVTMKITNSGTTNFDPSGVNVTETYGADGTPAQAVFDSAKDPAAGFTFTTILRPGRSLTSSELVGVPRGKLLTLQVQPNILGDQTAIFEGPSKP